MKIDISKEWFEHMLPLEEGESVECGNPKSFITHKPNEATCTVQILSSETSGIHPIFSPVYLRRTKL